MLWLRNYSCSLLNRCQTCTFAVARPNHYRPLILSFLHVFLHLYSSFYSLRARIDYRTCWTVNYDKRRRFLLQINGPFFACCVGKLSTQGAMTVSIGLRESHNGVRVHCSMRRFHQMLILRKFALLLANLLLFDAFFHRSRRRYCSLNYAFTHRWATLIWKAPINGSLMVVPDCASLRCCLKNVLILGVSTFLNHGRGKIFWRKFVDWANSLRSSSKGQMRLYKVLIFLEMNFLVQLVFSAFLLTGHSLG